MSIKKINNSLIEIENSILSNLDDIEYIDINIAHNCCSTYNQKLVINDTNTYKLCTALYCNYFNQSQPCGDRYPENCPNPQGSYYYNLAEIRMTINGITENILDRSYNLTQETEISFLEAYVNSKYDLTLNTNVYYDSNNYLCVELNFIDLPNGIKPLYFILRNIESCFIKQEFNCLSIIPNNECTEWVLKLNSGNIYNFNKLVFTDNSEQTINITADLSILSLDDAGMYLLQEFLDNSINLNIRYVVNNNILELYFTDSFNYIFGSINTVVTAFTLNCSTTTKKPSIPIYQVIIDMTQHELIYAVNVENPIYVAPVNLLTTPIHKNQITTLLSVLQLVDPIISGDLVELYTDVYKLTIYTYSNPVSDIITYSNYTDYNVSGFTATEITNISSNYNSDLVEYIHNKLYIKPKFFSAIDLFVDGIYSVSVDIVTKNTIYSHKKCIFVFKDICLINNLYLINKELGLKAALLYTMLVENSDCGCDCSTACTLYSELYNLLNNSTCNV